MIPITSRAFQDKVKLWILTHVDFTDYDLRPDMDSFHEAACAVYAIFKHEKHVTPRSGEVDRQNFVDWCMGLPSCLNTWDFLNTSSGVSLVADWMEKSAEERDAHEVSETFAELVIVNAIYKVIRAEYEKEMKK